MQFHVIPKGSGPSVSDALDRGALAEDFRVDDGHGVQQLHGFVAEVVPSRTHRRHYFSQSVYGE